MYFFAEKRGKVWCVVLRNLEIDYVRYICQAVSEEVAFDTALELNKYYQLHKV